MSAAGLVHIEYLRPPGRHDVFTQRVVHRDPSVIVTLMDATPLARELRIGGRVVLEQGSPVVWFTFPGAWHDIGRFHLADGTFAGFYANILTPVEFLDEQRWRTTDLCLDVWLGTDGSCELLDVEELEAAVVTGAIDAGSAQQARAEADRLLAAARAARWPPEVVRRWTLDASRAAVAAGTPARPQV